MFQPYHGRNRYRTFLRAGKTIAAKIAKLDGVVGILGTGAIGRRFGDRCSDLDLLVYAHRKSVKPVANIVSIGWLSYRGVDFDIEVPCYEQASRAKVPSDYWTQVRRWDHQNSQILYDTQDRLARLLNGKLVYPEREQRQLLEKYKFAAQEYLVYFTELWSERGEVHNVVHSLHRAVESIVLWVYAKNGVFEPYTGKWLFYHLQNRGVPEHACLSELARFYTTSINNVKEAFRARRELLRVCDQVGLSWDTYSCAEAQERCRNNWKNVSEKTREVLSW